MKYFHDQIHRTYIGPMSSRPNASSLPTGYLWYCDDGAAYMVSPSSADKEWIQLSVPCEPAPEYGIGRICDMEPEEPINKPVDPQPDPNDWY